MIDPQVAFYKLAQFETVEDLADYFKQEQIVGMPGLAFSCPIANWMRKQTGLRFGASPVIISEFDQSVEFIPTSTMVNFMSAFDSGQYPELRRSDTRWEDS